MNQLLSYLKVHWNVRFGDQRGVTIVEYVLMVAVVAVAVAATFSGTLVTAIEGLIDEISGLIGNAPAA